ncbi:hypothetical protein LOZ57_000968 [Ophidiomyces ophidiicola]|uniref:uncharacterized protein n=1 Tax=Ophidiomyces ophidiicola TaxID=1387563 RepID=UPI0020C4417F|nr:uncharacterized protein LOZ57_000968 [Ophidiomyces ophidiicola]KAI1952885.1 hypothetical protein LOZ57_000968 [Ophidiomyces ophidiicola]KAI2062005.1 hypothetical protein LOZ43_000754 [Ophidiomyces ophidiicola]KAI2089919.1 hypothetical protein LOZ36_001597 [Ophidiomyces ophidiicola]
MATGQLFDFPFGVPLLARVSRLLESNDVPNVLWGNFLVTIYGVPSLSNDIAFAVPNDKVSAARATLCRTDLKECNAECYVMDPFRTHPHPAVHFHLHNHDLYISIYPQSQVLPNLPNLTKSIADVISAADPSLPSPQVGYGSGALPPKYAFVRIPSPSCFTEACLINVSRLARKSDLGEVHYLCLVTYMVEYVYDRGSFKLDSLKRVFQDFINEAFNGSDGDAFINAKKKFYALDL